MSTASVKEQMFFDSEKQKIVQQAYVSVPPVLLALLSHFTETGPEILDLGCGEPNPLAYSVMHQHLMIDRVHMVDPALSTAKIRKLSSLPGLRLPELISHSSVVTAPVGFSAISMHPGFTLPLDLFPSPITWTETLQLLRPPYLSFCSYILSEHRAELSFLSRLSYKVLFDGQPMKDKLDIGSFCYGQHMAVVMLTK